MINKPNSKFKVRNITKDCWDEWHVSNYAIRGDGVLIYNNSFDEWTEYHKDELTPILFTGKKDVEGKDIYEGDIYQSDFDNKICYVRRYGSNYEGFCDVGWLSHGWLNDTFPFKIIGNVFDNPDLINFKIEL